MATPTAPSLTAPAPTPTKRVANRTAPVQPTPEATIPTPSAVVVAGNPLRDAIGAIESELNTAFAEREREIRGITTALLAREHVLLLGPAGTAKSALAETTCTALQGATFFQWLMTRFSDPSEIFGPPSLDGLKHDRYRRVTAGKLPEAHLVFLDEIFKANSAVLNSLLTAINERAFDNDGGRGQIPLETLVGASNELPEGAELAALWDRFILRYWTAYTKTPDSFRRLIQGAEPAIAARMSMADLKAAQAEVAAVPVLDSTVDELFKLRDEISKIGIVASDRRWRKAVRVLRATAWLEGATEVTPEAFPILANVLWETTDQISKLAGIVSRYTSQELAEAQEAADAIMEMINNMPPKGDDKFATAVMSVSKELKIAHRRIGELHAACRGAQSKGKIRVLAEDLGARYAKLKRDAAEALDL